MAIAALPSLDVEPGATLERSDVGGTPMLRRVRRVRRVRIARPAPGASPASPASPASVGASADEPTEAAEPESDDGEARPAAAPGSTSVALPTEAAEALWRLLAERLERRSDRLGPVP
ncbi:MAG: hypothetical protein H6511_02635 [Holophagales bacterium]|nr:hypothetical protein [Holophagales bacterium]